MIRAGSLAFSISKGETSSNSIKYLFSVTFLLNTYTSSSKRELGSEVANGFIPSGKFSSSIYLRKIRTLLNKLPTKSSRRLIKSVMTPLGLATVNLGLGSWPSPLDSNPSTSKGIEKYVCGILTSSSVTSDKTISFSINLPA